MKSNAPVHHGRDEVLDLDHILMVQVAYQLNLAKGSLCIHDIVKGIRDLLNGHLLVGHGIAGRAAEHEASWRIKLGFCVYEMLCLLLVCICPHNSS